jgi:hypothetical protein
MINKSPYPPLIRTLGRLQGVFWRRRLILGLVRALWAALLVPTLTLAGYLWGGWRIRWDIWVSITIVTGLLVLLWTLRPIKLKRMVHRLDKLLGLRAQLVTAFEASQLQPQPDNPVVGQLLQNSVELSVKLRRQVNLLDRNLWLEMHTLIGIAAVLGALLIFDALTPRIPEANLVDLPPLGQEPEADEVAPPEPQLAPPLQEQLQSLSQAQLQAALEALAEALRDQAVTRAAAEALDRGDIGGAAQELRRLADQLGELSEEARQGVGEALQQAAENIGGGLPGLTQPLESGSSALEVDNLPGAGQALEELAEALETIGETMQEGQPESEGEASGGSQESDQAEAGGGDASGEGGGDGAGDGLGGEGEEGLGEEEERLPIDGQPLEIESEEAIEDRVLQPAELDAQASEETTSDSPFARQGLNALGDDLGADPLTYPWEKRDIIRQYFTPSGE